MNLQLFIDSLQYLDLNQKVSKPAIKQESLKIIQTRSYATRRREWNKFLYYIKNNKIEQSWIKLLKQM